MAISEGEATPKRKQTFQHSDIYRASTFDEFISDPVVDSANLTAAVDVALNVAVPLGGGNFSYGHEKDRVKTSEHSISLEGTTLILYGDFGDDNAVIGTRAEDLKKNQGTPLFLRTAIILRRKTGRRFTISLEAETVASSYLKEMVKKLTRFGRECYVPIDKVEINPLSHVLEAE